MAIHFNAYTEQYDRGCYVINFRETVTRVESLHVTKKTECHWIYFQRRKQPFSEV